MTSHSEDQNDGIDVLSVQAEKAFVDGAGAPNEGIEEFYVSIPTTAGHKLDAKVWRYKSTPASDRPLILLLHGGGFFAGSKEMCTRPGIEFAEEFGAVVVSAGYRLCPDHAWPAPVDDGLDVVRFLSESATNELGANLEKGFVIGGFSAGANIAAVVTHQLRLDLKNPVTGHFSSIPHLCHDEMVPAAYRASWTSRTDNEPKDPGINYHSPLFSPFNSPEHTWKDLPRTFIQAGEDDLLRDDAVIYAEALRKAGVEVQIDVQTQIGHQCYSIWHDETNETHRELKQRTMRGVAWLLRKE